MESRIVGSSTAATIGAALVIVSAENVHKLEVGVIPRITRNRSDSASFAGVRPVGRTPGNWAVTVRSRPLMTVPKSRSRRRKGFESRWAYSRDPLQLQGFGVLAARLTLASQVRATATIP